uniref:B box-type domain-containing protein n=1 Tax=Ananas comosus var. bracteatus TaxID=296719 RepID=A0A6V7NL19_ANACO|nr:unnamed protein product [Ananas comosus var. bracteatus]
MRGERREMKKCELCDGVARMYCDSDEAHLCGGCDAKVHGANFLVARHTRALLCRTCQSPTPWRAAGARLGPAVSVCERCLIRGRGGGGGGGGGGEEGAEERGGEVEEAAEEVAEEEGENQVVPWALTPPPPPLTEETSSSSISDAGGEGDEESTRICNHRSMNKRMRHCSDLDSQDDLLPSSSSSHRSPPLISGESTAEDEATSLADPLLRRRPSKHRERTTTSDQPGSKPISTVNVAQSVVYCREISAVDFASSRSQHPPI